jgi:hypothetical protein
MWRAAALLVSGLLVATVAIAAPGEVRTSPPDAAAIAVCDAHRPRPDRVLIARCAQARGRVVWVRRSHGETHLALVGRFHLLVVKVRGRAPSIGAEASFTGALVRSRTGFRELQAW